jgi:hypothetical protein
MTSISSSTKLEKTVQGNSMSTDFHTTFFHLAKNSESYKTQTPLAYVTNHRSHHRAEQLQLQMQTKPFVASAIK